MNRIAVIGMKIAVAILNVVIKEGDRPSPSPRKRK